jgi:hypothetical protein
MIRTGLAINGAADLVQRLRDDIAAVGQLDTVGELAERTAAVLSRAIGNTVSPAVAALMTAAGVAAGRPEFAAWAVPASALAGSLTEEGIALVRQSWTDRGERVQLFAETAADDAGCTLDDLLAEAIRHPAKLELLVQAVEGASRALHQAKVEALARIVASGIVDDTKVDEMLVMMDVVRQLELPHLLILATLAEPPSGPLSGDKYAWRGRRLFDLIPGIRPAFVGLVAKLQSLALVTMTSRPDSAAEMAPLELTPFGRECARFLRNRRACSEDASPDRQ